MTVVTPGREELLALAEEIDINFRIGASHRFSDDEARAIQAALRRAAKPDEDGVRLLLTNLTGFVAGLRQYEIDPELRDEILNKVTAVKVALSTTGEPKPPEDREVAHEDCLNCRCPPDERCKP